MYKIASHNMFSKHFKYKYIFEICLLKIYLEYIRYSFIKSSKKSLITLKCFENML